MSRMNKRIVTKVAALCALVGCSGSAETSESLAPLPTTGLDTTARSTVVVTPVPSTSIAFDGFEPRDATIPLSLQERDYLEWVRERAEVPYPNEEIISWSATWCDFMGRGMMRSNVTAWIQEMSSNNEEAWAWLVSANASAIYICPNQEYKWNP